MNIYRVLRRNRLMIPFSALAISLGLIMFSAHVSSNNENEGQESDSLRREGSLLLTTQCVACHTLEIVTSQRLNKTLWTKELNKMVTWGATFDTSKADVLTDFLSTYYNPSSPETISALVSEPPAPSAEDLSSIKSLTGDRRRGEHLYNEQCAICHENPAEGVTAGTVLEGDPILKDDAAFWSVVLNGRHDMPSYRSSLSTQEAADILAWLNAIP